MELNLDQPNLTQPTLELDLAQNWRPDNHAPVIKVKTHDTFVDDLDFSEAVPTSKGIADWTEEDWENYAANHLADDIKEHLPSSKLAESSPTLPSIQEFTVAKLAEQYNYRGNLTVGALEDDIVFRIKRSALDVLEAGKALIILKEAVGHGNFGKRLSLMGFKERTARNYMRVAEKFGKSASSAVLVSDVGEYQKVLEMTFFDNDDIEALANGGDVDGINLEQIKSLSAPKLKKVIQSHIEAKSKPLIEQAEKDKAELEKQVSDLEGKIQNHEKHYSELQAKHEVTERQLKRLTDNKTPQKYNAATLAMREEATAAEYGVRLHVDEMKALFSQYLTATDNTPDDNEAQKHALSLAAGSMCLEVLELYQTITSTFELPELTGKFAMTDEEMKRLNDCRLMMNHIYLNDKTARELRREEKSRKGRPMGSSKAE